MMNRPEIDRPRFMVFGEIEAGATALAASTCPDPRRAQTATVDISIHVTSEVRCGLGGSASSRGVDYEIKRFISAHVSGAIDIQERTRPRSSTSGSQIAEVCTGV